MTFGVDFWIATAVAVGAIAVSAWLWSRVRSLAAAQRTSAAEVDRLQSFIAVSSDWTWEQDDQFRFTYVSDTVVDILGLSAAFCLGKTRREVAPESLDNLAFVVHEQQQALHAPIRNLRMRFKLPNDQIRYVEIDGDPVFDAGGRFMGYRGVGRDVTFLVEAEREASETQRRFLSAIEARSEGISFWDRDDRLRLYNSAYITLATGAESTLREGVYFQDYLQASVNSGVIPDAVGREEQWIADRLEMRKRAPSSHEMMRGERWLKVSELRTSDGWLLQTVLDISEAKERESAMRRAVAEAEIANRAKMEFLAVMSHELRTPLNAIIGFSDVIRNRVLGDAMDTYMRYAEHINESGTHLLALINDLLDVSRIEAGRLELEETAFSVSELMGECARMLRVRADDKDVDLTTDAGEPSLGLHADRRAVKQIIVNLVSNAIKFTTAGGKVHLRATLDEVGQVRIVVSDTGIGIPADRHEVVFRPFEQLENAHSRRHDGTGLGLYITRNLIEAHRGAIALDSVVGDGTTVTVTFPAERTLELRAEPSVAAGRSPVSD
ncbi:ATP-binding protein [Thalassobaculum sp. OXR-137]|uniref:PAS domain-containing sensor histidine kinase n=1 Tax=Thalassobaculum sp. OXR-137 TaxID=3100173 RepID=UPI002AC8E19A|nr:ATP-binding protein [Thalassobaculum sp. OXR-137]WPZ35105.1 ATP-binding protein [Thalassobaculum sp. OXR-137]